MLAIVNVWPHSMSWPVKEVASLNSLQPLPDRGLVNLLNQRGKSGDNLLLPFEQEIFLLEVQIAGTSYIDYIELTLMHMQVGDRLICRREPDNYHDEWAIRFYTLDGEPIGYIPKRQNQILARLMDAGKEIYGRYQSQEKTGDWLKVMAKVYMRD